MTQQIALRLPDDLARAIDTRAKKVGLSRNEWITRACGWLVDNAPLATTPEATDPKVKMAVLQQALDHVEQG